MNNIEAIDHSNKQLQEDADGVIPRILQQFPRLRTGYKTKFDVLEAPWGHKSRPLPFNLWQEATLTGLHSCDCETTLGGNTFEAGVWYYTGTALTDHQDLAGLENMCQVPQTIFGTEFRPQLNINLLNRLRMLEFEEAGYGDELSMVCSKCCKA